MLLGFVCIGVLALASQGRVYAVDDCQPFPDTECETWWRIDGCESGHGTHKDTYNLNAPNGGRIQINKATWEKFFLWEYGLAWEQIVLDDQTNRSAAYVIWLRAGNSWSPWSCY